VTSNPLPESEPERPPRAGLGLPRDILIAPQRAYARIATTPEWLPAYLLIAGSGLLAAYLMGPAIVHLASLPAPGSAPSSSQHDPAALAAASRLVVVEVAIQEVIVPLLMIGLTATALTLFARLRSQPTPYVRFVSLAANCLMPVAIGSLVGAAGVRLHPAAGYHDLRSLLLAVPDNLGVFADPHNEREVEFLARFDIFDVWAYILLGLGFATFAQIRLTTALALAFALDFAFALMF
jgi:hypothetical protein